MDKYAHVNICCFCLNDGNSSWFVTSDIAGWLYYGTRTERTDGYTW
jgi:hypothetical protein